MIPSVYQEIDAYRRVGRINLNAMLQVIYGNNYSVTDPLHQPIDSVTAHLIDACMYADTRIADWMAHGVTDEQLTKGIDWAINEAMTWRKTYGLPCAEGNEDAWNVKRYIVKCVRDNFNARKDPAERFDIRCRALCKAMGLSNEETELITADIPFSYAAEFISDMDDKEIHDAIIATRKALGHVG